MGYEQNWRISAVHSHDTTGGFTYQSTHSLIGGAGPNPKLEKRTRHTRRSDIGVSTRSESGASNQVRSFECCRHTSTFDRMAAPIEKNAKLSPGQGISDFIGRRDYAAACGILLVLVWMFETTLRLFPAAKVVRGYARTRYRYYVQCR